MAVRFTEEETKQKKKRQKKYKRIIKINTTQSNNIIQNCVSKALKTRKTIAVETSLELL